MQETFDAAAASTEDLTARYDDLTEQVADVEAQMELVRKGAVRDHPLYAKKLRSLTKERDELELHIKQRAKATKAAEKLATAEKKLGDAEKKAAEKKARATQKLGDARAKAAKKAEAAEKKAKDAAEKSAKAVKALADSWTGATLKSGEFLKAFKKLTPEQKKNDRIMDQVLDTYNSMRKILGPFNDELEHQWRMTVRLNPELAAQRKETEKLEKAAKKLADKALADLTEEQEKLAKAAEELNERLEAQRRGLLNLPTDAAIRDFAELTRTWERMNEAEKAVATEKYSEALRDAAEAGHDLNDAQIELATSAGSDWAGSFFDTVSKAFEGGGGFMGGIKSLATKAFGQIFSVVGGKSGGGFTDALGKIFSGEGLLGKLGVMGSKIGDTIGKFLSIGLNAVPIVGPFLAAFAPLIMKGIKKWGGKIWGVVKDVWTLGLHRFIGGPDAAEKAGRKTADAFRKGLSEGLSADQLFEARGRGDLTVIIAIRDNLIAAGMAADEATTKAEYWADALWKAEKKGGDAAALVVDQIKVVMGVGEEQVEGLTEDFDAFFEGVTAKQAPELTAAMIKMFADGREAGAAFGKATREMFEAVGHTVTGEVDEDQSGARQNPKEHSDHSNDPYRA